MAAGWKELLAHKIRQMEALKDDLEVYWLVLPFDGFVRSLQS